MRLWGTQNPRFFEGTVVAKEAAAVLAERISPDHRPTGGRAPLAGVSSLYAVCFCPVSEARMIMSSRRCRVTAASKPGLTGLPSRIASPSFA